MARQKNIHLINNWLAENRPMRTIQGWLLPVFMLPMAVYAQEATVKEVHDAPAVRGGVVAGYCCRRMTIRSRSILMTPTTFIYTQTSNLNKEQLPVDLGGKCA
ncbi:hypothetical protein ACNKHV_24280 [Shigella flexneri]